VTPLASSNSLKIVQIAKSRFRSSAIIEGSAESPPQSLRGNNNLAHAILSCKVGGETPGHGHFRGCRPMVGLRNKGKCI
jgi:hypothetical protein